MTVLRARFAVPERPEVVVDIRIAGLRGEVFGQRGVEVRHDEVVVVDAAAVGIQRRPLDLPAVHSISRPSL